MLKKFKNINLPSFLWFFFPILFFFIILFTKYFYLNFFINFFQSEKGIIENGTFVLLIISIILSFCILKNKNLFIFNKKIFFFIFFLVIGLIYFAGEEISWGQNWFRWNTSNFFTNYNDQSETNFHNISSWLDQKPKTILLFFVLFGGILSPLFSHNKDKNNLTFKYIFFPEISCFITSAFCLFFYLLDNSYKILCSGTPGIDISCKFIPQLFVFRTSEIIEFYIALFLLIYIFSIYKKIKINL